MVLEPSKRLAEFVEAAAERGLEVGDAVRLGFERALALADAGLLGLDVEAARAALNHAAARARPRSRLGAERSAYVRRLGISQPVPAVSTADGLRVVLPEDVLTRARGAIRPNVLHPGAVSEMVAWELAAAFEGRTLGEWALRSLALGRRGG